LAVIGIDLGTTNSLASVWQNGKCKLIPNSLGEYLTPSVVSIDENGEILTGKIAKERLISHPDRTASSFKRFMGTKKTYTLGSQTFRPEDLSSFIIRQLKADAEAYLKEPVTEAVISVPAYFNDRQRSSTKLAGELAGLKVERIINEPSAAALANRGMADLEKTFLVFDLGGGTLDVSIVEMFENIVQIVAISGDNHLGGDDFDAAIAERFLKTYPELKGVLTEQERNSVLRLAERCKIALSSQSVAGFVYDYHGKQYEMVLNEKQLIECCASLFERIKKVIRQALRDSGENIFDIDAIILVGGSSKMPVVQKYLKHLTGREMICQISPDFAVGIGAGIVTGIKSRSGEIKDLVLCDICPFSLGMDVYDEVLNRSVFSPIIEKNTPLPTSKVKSYVTRFNTDYVNVSVYQGESQNLDNNLLIDKFKVRFPSKVPKGTVFYVRYTYDINGILDIEVFPESADKPYVEEIINRSTLSEEEFKQHMAAMSQLKLSPNGQDEDNLLIARGERLYAETSGETRREIERALTFFECALKQNGIVEIERAKRNLTDLLDQIEDTDFGLNEDDFI
jgi:molecular chaperone HscC